MARIRSVDFLPEIFQTDANKQFLSATLDQLIQEPKFKRTQGFIGQTVGPGVDPNDRYVVEPTATRANYQLEPGVVSLKADTNIIKDAITYPGINDAIGYQGGISSRPDLLYQSEYYTWDPFIDYDAFVNFSQYYWLPNGPDTVEVRSTGIPVTNNFSVTRDNGVYTFSGVAGDNPTLELVRGGSYTFQVAQNQKETVNYRVRNSGITAYVIDFENNPTLTLSRGNTYVFNLALQGDFPFWIKTSPTTGRIDAYNSGVSRNGASIGLVTFTVPQDAPDVLYYAAENQTNMRGTLRIVDGTPGTGPGFWIQTDPGVSGTIPATPNISSRDVLGVINNGEDLGTVIFNVPYKTAQNFYYNLTDIGTVDLFSDLRFDQINNQGLQQFLATHGGIDGVSYLNSRTLVFAPKSDDVEAGGWQRTTLYDPLNRDNTLNGQPGSYDTTTYDQVTPIPPEDRYQIYTISLITENNYTYIQLNRTGTIDALEKFTVRYGTRYSNTVWYKTPAGILDQQPLLSAVQDTLYYQDGTDPGIFGRIKLIDQSASETLDVDEILGQQQYTSPNGVVFSNGLKIRFVGSVTPSRYASGIQSFVSTATNAATNYITTSDTSGLYIGQRVVFSSPTLGGLTAGRDYYITSVASQFEFAVAETPIGRPVQLQTGTGTMSGIAIASREFYVSAVGQSIELLPLENFFTPETYIVNEDPSTQLPTPTELDYLTIDRASQDLNAWSRSNRWFHVDVINATAQYNNTVAVLDNNFRGKRPIIQFRADLRLFNMGTQGKQPVDIIDFNQTDAFSNVEGSTGYTIDGFNLVQGSRVIFAADEDINVRNKIWLVQFIEPDTVPPLQSQPVINLVQTTDSLVLNDQSTVCLEGDTLQGLTFWFDGLEWFEAQQKTAIQQAPLFDVYDNNGFSFGDFAVYPSTDFVGSKLFSYAISDTSALDPILGFALKYLNLENVGDIVFENNLYLDTFVYTRDNVSVTLPISTGFAREYTNRTEFQRLIGWQNAITTSKIYQQFKFQYSGPTLKLDVRVDDRETVPVIKIYAGSRFIEPSRYTYARTSVSTTIDLLDEFEPGTILEVLVLSQQTSQVAFYQVPINLENNPLNGNSQEFTLGTIRTHYQSICENLPTISGSIAGANNTRDLGNIGPYGLIILQQSAPMTMAGYFLRSESFNIFNSLTFNSQEYTKFKNQILNAVTQQFIVNETTAEILDRAIESLTAGRVEDQPFYWSDMLPSGAVYIENSYTVGFTTINVFDTVQVYDYSSANYLGMNIYLNNEILVRGLEYTVATDGPRVTITVPLAVNDVVTIREYQTTYGSFVPNTPSKMGLYPAFEPKLEVIKTSQGNQTVIIGHDGSITKTFDDVRDDVLLEFEKRIYNNIKMDGNPLPLDVYDVLPGQFRSTGYAYADINNIFAADFLSFVAWNKLDYQAQRYSAQDEFTYNYSAAQNKLNNQDLLGAWRGIYRYFYDTEQPQLTPWQMLGFSIKPDWWDERYGAAPYTSGNLVLWDDLEQGYIADPDAPRIDERFARPGLSLVIPVGSEGELLPPYDTVMGLFDDTRFRKSWSVGDGGPVEASWWNSSSYPFAVMRLLALTRPAKFFSLFADRDLYRYDLSLEQFLYNERYRLDANGIQVYGNGVSKASFINWIVDYNRQTGIDSTEILSQDLANLDVRLCYRMASFSDKQYIKLYTEKSSPNSLNTTFLIPDESYNLLLYKNQPFDRINYSSVLIQQVPGGYSVGGYSTTQPYFNIMQSIPNGRLRDVTVERITVRVPTNYSDTVLQVPYGFVFADQNSVVDFLLSLGEFYDRQGITFTNRVNGQELNWLQMSVEFLYWSQQGWDENAIINLNPLAFRCSVTRPTGVVDSIATQTAENLLLDQNRKQFPTRDLNIVRYDNTFTIEPLNDQTLSYVELRYTAYEHMIVLDNVSVFGDLIYEPITGARQSRLNISAYTTTEWNGSVDAQGFVLNQNNIQEWSGLRTYTKGDIVLYKNAYWSALDIVNPSAEFNYNEWSQSDYDQIQIGLLPNLANKANQLVNSYNINQANLEIDNDLLSYGLIGFRPRQYMAALNLDDISQVNIYRQFLGSKGTVQSAELFSQANLGKELGNYSIYENWAVLRSVYGANANRSWFELRLNRALLSSNPSLVQVTLPQQQSQADQTILLSNLWRQSYKIPTTNILPTTRDLPTDTALPSAGYVNLNDVDLTVYRIDDPANLAANINSIEVGSSIWVANVNDYDWNVYRATQVPGAISHVCDNLDFTSLVIFTAQHGLSVGQRIIIRFFDVEVDGVYEVLTVPSLTKITIRFAFIGDRTVVNGTGIAFTLESMRVSQASDAIGLSYVNDILPGARIWVDDIGDGRWAVLQKQQVFSDIIELRPEVTYETELFGTSVAQAEDRFAALVGAPNFGLTSGTARGAVYVYVRNSADQYQPISPLPDSDAIFTLDVTGVRGYGNAVTFGRQTWAAAGASASLGPASEADVGYASVIFRDPALGQAGVNPYAQWQLLTPPSVPDLSLPGEFGYSMAMSQDQRWLYIGAPGVNKVLAYGRVDWQDQVLRTISDGTQTQYAINQVIQINSAQQISISVDDTLYIYNVDWTIDPLFSTVTFVTVPPQGGLITVTRLKQKLLDGDTYFNVTQSATSGSGSGAEFTVVRVRGSVGQPGGEEGSVSLSAGGVNYNIADTVTIPSASFDGGGNNITLTITNVDGGAITEFTIAYTPPALTTVFSLNEYFFTVNNINSFSILVDDVLQRPNIDYSFNAVNKDITFINSPAQGTRVIARAQGYFEYVAELPTAGLSLLADERFGHSISCSTDGSQIIVGCKDRAVSGNDEAGEVFIFNRNVQRFIYGTDPSSVTFTVLGPVSEPVNVSVNGQFLINEQDSVLQGPNTFQVTGNDITLNTDLQVGDIIEISTNQFTLVQSIQQQISAEFSNFGQAVDICDTGCSLYIGAPQSSVQIYKGGVVEVLNNQSRLYGGTTGINANPSLTPGDTLRVNNTDVVVPVQGTVSALATAINSTVPNVLALVTNGILSVSVKNFEAAPAGNKLTVLPGSIGSAFDDIGFTTFIYNQTLQSPYATEFAAFGAAVQVDSNSINLVVGAPNGTIYLETVFDDGTTEFDGDATVFFSLVFQSGSVYTFDLLSSASPSAANPSKFIFGNQVSQSGVGTYNRYGAAVDYTSGTLMVGAPQNDFDDSSAADFGAVFVFENNTRTPAWVPTRLQEAAVDIRLLNSVFLYDRITSARTEFLDFFNPLQGKILGAARQNIDYIGAVDPAGYNSGPTNLRGTTWGADHLGEIWWDISTVRFIDPNQDDIVYASRRWGQIFPGSTVDVYQWIVSPVPPSVYAGPGTPRDSVSFTINSVLANDGLINTEYFFWVRGITETAVNKGKSLSAETVARYIQDPRATGIAFIAPINSSTFALYNCETLLEAQDTILHIEFDRQLTNDNVHVDYELIPQDRADGFLSDLLYRKLQDSFCGVDTAGNLVPDPNLSIAERYGVQFRPRQSMFADRFTALKNYLVRVNSVFKLLPITENRSFRLLNSEEPEPTESSGEWDRRVPNQEILIYSFEAPGGDTLGLRYLVQSDSRNRGLWTIYTVEDGALGGNPDLVLTRVQNFNTKDYWQYIDWYLPGYNPSTKIVAEVTNASSLDTLSLPIGSSVKVLANAQNKFEIYQLTDLGWQRVALQDGTIQINAEIWDYEIGRFGYDVEVFDAQYFDQEPVIETRQIIKAINQELLIDDLLIERNRALVLMFNFVLSEFEAPEWLVKTSLIDVDHRIRELLPFQNYVRDNQEFVSDYIQEVKPYHVQIREFNLQYTGDDEFFGDLSDFDVPAFFDTQLEIPQFVSPILLPYQASTTQIFNTLSDTPANSEIWQQWPYSQWFNNYLLTLDEISVVESGQGYQEPPVVNIVGDAAIGASAVAIINASGQVIGVNIIDVGSGYRTTPTVTFEGGNGTGARAYARLTNPLVRDFRVTMKYDRYQYRTSVLTWSPEGTYENGTLVRYDNRVWEAQNSDGSSAVVGPTFDLENWVPVSAATLTGVDRTMGFYVPGVNSPGLELPLLVSGIDYPGVQVWGDYFAGILELDANYQSDFTDIFLGTRPTDINVDGGEFIGPYEGHAPEELINGSEFDTLDLKVFTRPGSDWTGDGHGFQISSVRFEYVAAIATQFSYRGVVENPAVVAVSNVSTGLVLAENVNYFIDYSTQLVTIQNGAATGDIIDIAVYEIGGGSQLYRNFYTGAQIATGTFVVPVNSSEIYTVVVFENGQPSSVPTWVPYTDAVSWNINVAYQRLDVVTDSGVYYRALQAVPAGIPITDSDFWLLFVPTQQSLVTLNQIPLATDGLDVVVLGFTTPQQYSWSTPVTEVFVADAIIVGTQTLNLDANLGGTNAPNLIVLRNGIRMKPPACVEHFGDDSSVDFALPTRTGFSQQLINPNTDVKVWVDNELQQQQIGAVLGDYFVTLWAGTEDRQVVFYTPPPAGARILISVSTQAQYNVAAGEVQIIPLINLGDVFQVISWNDTSQQNILTLTFVGPVTTGIIVTEPYDSTNYDTATVSFTPGSYDFSIGTAIPVNDFYLGRTDVDASRLFVTLNGFRLFEGRDFLVENGFLILGSGAISATDAVVVTEFTNSIVPESMGFRVFQDMRGVQATYRITQSSTTQLAQPLAVNDDIIYVQNAQGLSQPDPLAGNLGVVMINGERIVYRVRDLASNTLSSLLRGTAGTATSSHDVNSVVTDIGLGNLLLPQYQDYYVRDTSVGDGSTTIFYAPNIDIADFGDSSSVYVESIEVYVGGVRQYNYSDPAATSQYRYIVTDFEPLAIEFIANDDPINPSLAPPEGVEVTVVQRRGTWWYNVTTAEQREKSLQETDSQAAQFLRAE